MLELFQVYATPQQKELAAMVKEKGGNDALKSESTMKELADKEYALNVIPCPESQPSRGRPFDFVELQQEINSDPDEAIRNNSELFDRIFTIQRRQIEEDFICAFQREGDRIVSAVKAGPHDGIVDPVRNKGLALP